MMRELSLNNCRLDGRYDIREQLGRGSYAEIYVARDTLASPQSPHSAVVIKALNVFLQNDLDADLERTLVENFQNEAIALDRVRHPNIISRLGHGTARDLRGTVFHYLALEYLPGGDLARYCREKSLSLRQALKYLEQICAGLGHAHRSGIIHRDIKPQNLLLTKDRETVKIADFGVARATESDSPITRVGTNVFAPPEHSPMLSGNTGTLTVTELTPAADIYSLAKSAYALITCESPRFFVNQPITELPFALRTEDWAAELLKVLNKATQVNPKSRHQNVNEFWQDLGRIKKFAEENEGAPRTNPAPQISPQPHVARGYTPIAPVKPRFNTSRDMRLKNLSAAENPSLVIRLGENPIANGPLANSSKNGDSENIPSPQPPPNLIEITTDREENFSARKKSSSLRRLTAFVILLGLFAGILYATHNYLRGAGVLPVIRNPFRTQYATASGDVYLRTEPNASKPAIGIVTKDSRLKIVGTSDNWYEVDIIEHGRPKINPDYADHGWVSGKYIEIAE